MFALRHIYGPLFQTRTYLEAAYLMLGLITGILWFTLFITLYAVGIGTLIIWVGLGILIATQAALRPVGAFERAQIRALLGFEIAEPAPLEVEPVRESLHPEAAAFWRRAHALLHDGHGWRVLAWALLRLVTGTVGFSLAVTFLSVVFASIASPLIPLLDLDVIPGESSWENMFLLGPVALLIVGPTFAWIVRWTADFHRWFGMWALGPCGVEVRQAALARASLAEEQVRIDQELHDSIGHMISMIVVQAGAGAHVFDRDPDFARRALSTIEERGRAALGELDRIIARIRGDAPESHVPLPDARDLLTLVSGARDAGIDIHAAIEIGDMPVALGRGVYRVVQEAVTNAAKHAPGRRVDVSVASDSEVVAVSVQNPQGPDADEASGRGNGLASIRDRVAILGGRATIGPTGGGDFAVRAILPLGAMLPDGAGIDCRLTARCRCLVCSLTRKVRA